MRLYALRSAPLYTPISIRAPALVRRLLGVADFLVRLSSFHFPLLHVRRLILLIDDPVFGSI